MDKNHSSSPFRTLAFPANLVLLVTAAAWLLLACNALSARAEAPFRPAIRAAAGVALLLALRLRPSIRIRLAILIVSTIASCYILELALDVWLFSARPASAAIAANRPFDTRTTIEVVEDLRAAGLTAFPALTDVKETLLRRHGSVSSSLLTSKSGELVPLAGVAGVTTVLCNESGTYAVYKSDRYGFNNPDELWDKRFVDIAIVGDSFVHGYCVPADYSLGGQTRQRIPATLSLGMGGNGPLMELATLSEYASLVRPKIVIWAYYENDLRDLEKEKSNRVLSGYLDDSVFQDLAKNRDQVNAAVRAYLQQTEKHAPRWRPGLSKWNIHREDVPFWTQDLITGSDITIAQRFLRLITLRYLPQIVSEAEGVMNLDLFEKVLLRADNMVTKWGGKLYFVFLPSYDEAVLGRTRAASVVLNRVQRSGIPIIEVRSAFGTHAQARSLFFYRGSHYTEAGYRRVAQAVLRGIQAERSIPTVGQKVD